MKLNNVNSNLIYNSLKEVEEEQVVPAGYIEIKLSTKGKVGAPESFHIRNFKVGELVDLSLTSDTDLPTRLINILNEMILEDVDVANFHEKEVEELMLSLYSSFYTSIIEDIQFPYNKEDLDYLLEKNPELLDDINSKKWTPRTNIDIFSGVDTYDISDDFKSSITIRNKDTGFYVTFDFIKYSDRLTVKKWLDKFFEEQENKYRGVANAISNNRPVDPELEEEYNKYLSEKFRVLSDMSRIISIVDYNGIDTSKMSVSEKYNMMANDARIDFGMISKLIERQNKMPFGIKPMVRMLDPITNEPCERRFSFRISTIIQAMQISGSNKYDDGYDDEVRDDLV